MTAAAGGWDRARELERLASTDWDLVVVGGGITGAGVAREAARRGWRVALVEQRDFAWGTSSRSSKLVHGGLRYLRQGRFGLTLESVRERERLVAQAPDLIEPQSFAFVHRAGRGPGRHQFALGLAIYDRIAGQRAHRWLAPAEAAWLLPGVPADAITGASCYLDARTDDARLVQRVLAEARRDGAVVLNDVRAERLLIERGRVRALALHDGQTGAGFEVGARCVVNATGAWGDALRADVGGAPALRPLRGSHLVVPFWRLPVAVALSLMHPADGRPVFLFPWEGATLVGTTDLDHQDNLAREATATAVEVRYLLDAVNDAFPRAGLRASDVVACFAGVRPIIDAGRGKPSDAAREHVVRDEAGLVTVCGGKLTTFRTMALQALARAAPHAGKAFAPDDAPVFAPAAALDWRLPAAVRQRLAARYGADAARIAAHAQPGELETVEATPTLWLELRIAAQEEAVMHLDDLLLRRTRIGLLASDGALAHEPRIRSLCQAALGWSDARWDAEVARYRDLIRAHYALPAAV